MRADAPRPVGRPSASGFEVTVAGPADLGVLVEHRLEMRRDIHPELTDEIERSRVHTRKWIRRKLSKGELVAFVARAPGGRVAGSGCVLLREEQPRPNNPLHVIPYLMSMCTEAGFRRRGVAKGVLEHALKRCRVHSHRRTVLHASQKGRHLYEKYGFRPAHEQRLDL